MLDGELDRQQRLKTELAKDPETAGWLDDRKVFQNYKQLQFIDTLALYFNRIHPTERIEQEFENVPMDGQHDVSVVIRPSKDNVYTLTPFPFAVEGAQFAFSGRPVEPALGNQNGSWPAALRKAPTRWDFFRLAAG